MLLEVLKGHAHGLHIAEILDFLHALMCDRGALRDQLFVVRDSHFPPFDGNDKIVILSALVGEADVKAVFFFRGLVIVNLAHIIPPRSDELEGKGAVCLILDRKRRLTLRVSPDGPAV